ncbi:MAG TPA: hypothetical protein VG603_10150, partial [Chitinophagales bacterium]|nr:hypothetical protein [Chitinophagales bacterium]
CHSDSASANGANGFDIENFSQLKAYLDNYYRNDSVYGSKFMATLTGQLYIVHMPPNGGLPTTDVMLLQNWVKLGAPAN